MRKIITLTAFILWTASGCFWPFSGARPQVRQVSVADGVSVEVIDPVALKRGGKLYFMPFSAGADAEAGEKLDRLALIMVKGASDALEQGGGFVLVSGDDASNADVVIKGHIEEFRRQGSFKKVVCLKIRGDVRESRADEVLGLIYVERKIPDAQKDVDQAAYDMGYAIARKLSQ